MKCCEGSLLLRLVHGSDTNSRSSDTRVNGWRIDRKRVSGQKLNAVPEDGGRLDRGFGWCDRYLVCAHMELVSWDTGRDERLICWSRWKNTLLNDLKLDADALPMDIKNSNKRICNFVKGI